MVKKAEVYTQFYLASTLTLWI